MMRNRIISILLTLTLLLCLVPALSREAEAAVSSQAEAVVETAIGYAKSGKSIGVMCAGMVCKAAKAAGLDSSQINFSARYAVPFVGSGQFGFITSSGQFKYGCTAYTWKDFLDGTYKPQTGDLVFYGCMKSGGGTANLTIQQVAKNGKYFHKHVALIRNNNSTTKKLYTVDGGQNTGKDKSYTYVKVKDRTVSNSKTGYLYCDSDDTGYDIYVMEFVRPNYKQDFTVELFNNYSGKNYMPAVEASDFRSDCFYSRDTAVATVTADSAEKHTADCDTLKIVNTSAGSSGKDLVFTTHTSGRASAGDYAFDQTLTLSFWAKASSPGAAIYFRWGYESEDAYRSVTLSRDWAYYTVRMDRTTAVNSNIHPYVDRAGTVWLSEIQLEEGSYATSFAAENGGTLSVLTASSSGKYTGLPTPSRDGYAFAGWYTKPDGGTLITSDSSVLNGNIRLYAHWTAGQAELFCNYSGKNYLPAVEADHFDTERFLSRDLSVATITGDSTVKRVVDCDTLKIVNTSAGKSGTDLAFAAYMSGRVSDGSYSFDQALTLSFWAKATNPGAKMYFRWGFESTSAYRSVTLTGDWAHYTVKMDRTTAMNNYIHPYVDRAGTVWISELQLEDGSAATAFAAENGGRYGIWTASNGTYLGLPILKRDGYDFDGWYTKPDGGTRVTDGSAALPGNACLYAHWLERAKAELLGTASDGLVTYQTYACADDLPEGGVTLCIARYDAGKMTAYAAIPLTGETLSGTCRLGGSGTQYRLFLVTPEFQPLSPCFSITEQ